MNKNKPSRRERSNMKKLVTVFFEFGNGAEPGRLRHQRIQ